MSAKAAQVSSDDTSPAPRGFPGIRCPACGAEESIRIMAHTGACECGDCDVEIDRETIEGIAAQWSKLLGWLDAMPYAE